MKKFNFSFLLLAALVSGLWLNSCNKDNFSEEDAMNLQAKLDKQKQSDNDSLDTRNYRVTYTVNLVDASTSALKSTSTVLAVTGAQVKLIQDTLVVNKTVDESGIATFSDLKPGLANIRISLTNYSTVNYTVNLATTSLTGGRQISNIIPLIPIAGTSTGIIKGKVTCETDLTNKTPEVAPVGTKVLAMVDVNSDALPTTGSNSIVSISYDDLSLTATTDANGEFSMTVPATIRGLNYNISVSDFTADQKLLQDTYFDRDTFGVLTIPANFGSSFQSASSVSLGEPVVVTIGAPDYTYTPAVATAVIDNANGIEHINITNNGGLYAQHTGYTIPLNDASIVNSSTTPGSATFDVNAYGRVTNISVSSGSKYLPAAENFELVIPYAQVEAVITANVTGGVVTSASVTTQGRYYVNRPEDVYFSYNGSGGSGATFTPSFSYSAGAYYVSGVSVTNGGNGYTDGQTFNIKSSLSQQAKGRLHMTSGFLSAINVTDEGSNYISSQVSVVIGSPSIIGGTQATATATVTNGKISSIAVNTAGTGYTTAPTVTIVNKAEKVQAVYAANLSNGQITSFSSVNQGNGYLSVPSVTITSAIPGAGSGASAYAVVSGGKITSLSLVNGGAGYRGNTPSNEKDFSGTTYTTVTGSTTSIIIIDLGTGKRTIEE